MINTLSPRRFLVLLFFILISCGGPGESIKIGLAINLSGRGGEAGEHIREGAMLAVQEINECGGINGRPLELLVQDDQNSDSGILAADNALIAAGVPVIIGHSHSANTLKAYPHVTAANTLLISPYTGTTELSGKDDLFLRTAVDCVLYGKKTAELLKKYGKGSVAVLMDMDNESYVLDYLDNLRRHFSGPVFPVGFQSSGLVAWSRIMKELLAPEPDAILLLTEASMTGIALQKLQNENYGGLCVGSIWAHTPSMLRFAGSAADNFLIVSFVNPENNRPEYKKFSEMMQSSFGKPASPRSARSYEAVMIIADALKRCRVINGPELKEKILAGSYPTLLGQVSLDRFGDVVRPIYEVGIKDNTFRNNGEI